MQIIPPEVESFIRQDVLERFLRYVQFDTTPDADSKTNPSTERQWELAQLLVTEAKAIGADEVTIDSYGHVYATLSGAGKPIGFLSHIDTSPEQSGAQVKPQVHAEYSGGVIRFPDDSKLELSTVLSPELSKHIGDTIITASGQTLLGADDKSGCAIQMTLLATLKKFPELQRAPLTLVWTHDEEIGRGIDGLDLGKLPKSCYTLDGGEPGSLESECFDAWGVSIKILGRGTHPGYAKGKMINAGVVAAWFVSQLPAQEAPPYTEKREGFYYVNGVTADVEHASIALIIRDHDEAQTLRRRDYLSHLVGLAEKRFPGVTIAIEFRHQYPNMRRFIDQDPSVVASARRAIERVGLTVSEPAIRGGTDGSLLSAKGVLTPNIFTGQMMIHSRLEWIALSSLVASTKTALFLVEQYADAPSL